MASATTAWCNTNLSYYPKNTTSVSVPTYLGLFTVAPTAAGGGTEVTTTQVTNYARIALTPTDWAPGFIPPITVTYSSAITLPASTGGTGATVVAWGLFDALTGGNLLFFNTLSFLYTPGVGLVIPANALTVSLSNPFTPVGGNVTNEWALSNLYYCTPGGNTPVIALEPLNYIAWFTDLPTLGGVEVTAIQVTNYARTPVPAAVWGTPSSNLITNTTSISTVTSSGGTGVVVKAAVLYTQPPIDEPRWVFTVSPNWSWNPGDQGTIDAGHLNINLF